jgi:glutathione S-transferase
MSAQDAYQVYGALGSPYSMKMRAVLRYRRLPYVFHFSGPGEPEIAHVKPPVIPVLRFPDGSWHVDSTPMIEELEQLQVERSIVPEDPVQAFLAFLLEDFADEWATKWMFHYRWYYDADRKAFSRWGAFDRLGPVGAAQVEKVAAMFTERQVGRMALVGCTEENRSVIEGTFVEAAEALNDMVSAESPYLFGSQPSRADFGLYGQFSQLTSDPTPDALLRERAPYTYRWVKQLDDACGVEGEWLPTDSPLPQGTRKLLCLCGEVYLPFLVANAAAFERGDGSFAVELHGRSYAQAPFKYQVKCLAELRRRFAALETETRKRVEDVLADTLAPRILAAAG